MCGARAEPEARGNAARGWRGLKRHHLWSVGIAECNDSQSNTAHGPLVKLRVIMAPSCSYRDPCGEPRDAFDAYLFTFLASGPTPRSHATT